MDASSDLNDLLQLEHSGWKSLCDGTGAEFYGGLMTADAVMVLAHGQALDRDAVVASLGGAPAWNDYNISDERLIQLSDQGAILIYTGRGHRDGEEPFVALMSSVYVRDRDRWKLVLYQQTPVPSTQPPQ
jgi:hypothetical protein